MNIKFSPFVRCWKKDFAYGRMDRKREGNRNQVKRFRKRRKISQKYQYESGKYSSQFVHRVVTSDEKFVHYDNSKRKKSWGMTGHASTITARPDIHGAKVMLCIWWDQLGVVYYELSKLSETITEDRYRTQLMRLSRALKEKWPQYQERRDKVISQHDNARPHVARPVRTYLETLK